MKLIDYVYFNLYRWYNKMKTEGRKVDPENATSMIFGLSIGGWFILIDVIYHHFFLKIPLNNIDIIISAFIMIISWGLVNTFYSKNERYLIVYTRYMASDIVKNKAKEIFISFLFLLLPYILLPIFVITFT